VQKRLNNSKESYTAIAMSRFQRPEIRQETKQWNRVQENRVQEKKDPIEDLTNNMGKLMQDFPELPRKSFVNAKPFAPVAPPVAQVVPPVAQVKGRFTYAQLASAWKEESTEVTKEKPQVYKPVVKKVISAMITKKKADSDDDLEVDIGCHVSDHSDQADPSDPEEEEVEEEEEEEVEEDPDAFWTQRKHKGDIY
jgi:hypothetical protein